MDATLVTPAPFVIAGIRHTIAMSEIRDFFDTTFQQVGRVVGEQSAQVVGPAVGVYWGQPTDTADLAAGLPTAEPVRADGDVVAIEISVERAVQTVHHGSYDDLADTYTRLAGWIAEQGLSAGELVWESYLTEPTPGADPAGMQTQITWSVTG